MFRPRENLVGAAVGPLGQAARNWQSQRGVVTNRRRDAGQPDHHLRRFLDKCSVLQLGRRDVVRRHCTCEGRRAHCGHFCRDQLVVEPAPSFVAFHQCIGAHSHSSIHMPQGKIPYPLVILLLWQKLTHFFRQFFRSAPKTWELSIGLKSGWGGPNIPRCLLIKSPNVPHFVGQIHMFQLWLVRSQCSVKSLLLLVELDFFVGSINPWFFPQVSLLKSTFLVA